MNKKSNEKWIMFKNFLHNELEISKDDIHEWIQEAVKEEARLMVDKTYNNFDVKNFIKDAVMEKQFYGDSIKDRIIKEVAKLIFEKVKIEEK